MLPQISGPRHHNHSSRIEGILLEGVDFVGKTSVAARLLKMLEDERRDVVLGKCYLTRHPVIEFLEARAKEHETMLARDWYYTAALMADLSLYEGRSAFVVQDRHWLTQIGRNKFFHAGLELLPDGVLERKHIPFRYNVLLTSTFECKLERNKSRPPNSPRDAYLAANPHLHQEYEAFLVSLIPKDESWIVVDTTHLSIDEIVHRLRTHIEDAFNPGSIPLAARAGDNLRA